jgi:hypothetical protein
MIASAVNYMILPSIQNSRRIEKVQRGEQFYYEHDRPIFPGWLIICLMLALVAFKPTRTTITSYLQSKQDRELDLMRSRVKADEVLVQQARSAEEVDRKAGRTINHFRLNLANANLAADAFKLHQREAVVAISK